MMNTGYTMDSPSQSTSLSLNIWKMATLGCGGWKSLLWGESRRPRLLGLTSALVPVFRNGDTSLLRKTVVIVEV